ADLAICEAIVAVLQLLVRENWSSYSSQQQMPTAALAQVLQATTQHAEQAVVREPALLQHFGIHQPAASVADIWRALTEQVAEQIHHLPALRVILDQGTLSRRMCHALQSQHCSLQELYEQLCQCLAHNRPLHFQ
ncbi:MAG: hypothetical protein KDA45_06185, partial [Planctomycetales bacterium]|nr:hypothetical protein [Planctomycetales bacterium]